MKILKDREKLIFASNLDDAKKKQRFVAEVIRNSKEKIKNFSRIRRIAGVDVGYKGEIGKIAIVFYDFKTKTKEKEFLIKEKVSFPYIPGFLSFREGALIVKAFKKIDLIPDVIIFDGQGEIHPEGLGLATHTGFVLDIPSIGCAKRLLYGTYKNLGNKKFSQRFVKDRDGKIIGVALRSKENTKPIFISKGYGITLDVCIKLIKGFISYYRLPDIMREAHILSKK